MEFRWWKCLRRAGNFVDVRLTQLFTREFQAQKCRIPNHECVKALINIELAIKKHWFKSKSDARKNAGKVKPCMIVFIYIYIDYMFNSWLLRVLPFRTHISCFASDSDFMCRLFSWFCNSLQKTSARYSYLNRQLYPTQKGNFCQPWLHCALRNHVLLWHGIVLWKGQFCP